MSEQPVRNNVHRYVLEQSVKNNISMKQSMKSRVYTLGNISIAYTVCVLHLNVSMSQHFTIYVNRYGVDNRESTRVYTCTSHFSTRPQVSAGLIV